MKTHRLITTLLAIAVAAPAVMTAQEEQRERERQRQAEEARRQVELAWNRRLCSVR